MASDHECLPLLTVDVFGELQVAWQPGIRQDLNAVRAEQRRPPLISRRQPDEAILIRFHLLPHLPGGTIFTGNGGRTFRSHT